MISVFVWAHFRSVPCAVISFLAGFAIDADHLLDYFSTHKFTFNIRKIYYTCLRMRMDTLYLVLHSYELTALLWTAIYVFSLSNAWKAAAIGITQHMILDQLTNPLDTFAYFTTYRMSKGFKKTLLMRKGWNANGNA